MTELEWVMLLDVEGAMGSVCNYDGNPMDTRIYIYIYISNCLKCGSATWKSCS